MSHPVAIVGMGMSPADLTARHREIITAADILVGGRRHLAVFENLACERIPVASPLEPLMARLRHRGEARVVVLASGDPLYYGIGAAVTAALGPGDVVIHPNITAVAAAFSRIRIPWQDAGVVSFHGRTESLEALSTALSRHSHVAVFTDPRRHPALVAMRLAENGWGHLRMWVFERMGDARERITCDSAHALTGGVFSEPNLVVVETGGVPQPAGALLGRPDSDFVSDGGLITKREVRAVALSLMALERGETVWDLGAGSGAVALEAAALVAPGRVFAVEKNPRRAEMIAENSRRLGATALTPVAAELPGALDDLPDPNAVFVGGGGNRLGEIIAAAVRRLRPGGRMVVSAVMLGSVETALSAMTAAGLAPEFIQVQISRGVPIAGNRRLEALNPVWLVHGRSGHGKGDHD